MGGGSMITVVDVIRDMGIEPEPNLTWAVGAAVRDLYEDKNGRLPEKRLRTKTDGHGSHCFAVYPESMRPEIEKIVGLFETNNKRQGTLF